MLIFSPQATPKVLINCEYYSLVKFWSNHNLRQGVVDKFTKLSEEGFSISWCKYQNFPFGWPTGLSALDPSISGILFFFNFSVLSFKLCAKLGNYSHSHSHSDGNNLVPFHLWWREIVLKRERAQKCFAQDSENLCKVQPL